MKRRPARAMLWALLALHLPIALAGFFAPSSPTRQHRDSPDAPPTRLRFIDAEGRLHLRPFVYRRDRHGGAGRYVEDTKRRYAVRLFAAGDEYRLAGLIPCRRHLLGVDAPARLHPLGTDALGRDQFSRILYGGGVSLAAGLLAAALSLTIGAGLGIVAGYSGGWIDGAVMRLGDIFLALPWLYLLLAVRALLPLDLAPAAGFAAIVLLVGLVGWARPARLVRAAVLRVRQREFVLAARSIGAAPAAVMVRHVLPQTAPILLTEAALMIPRYLLAEVTLSFLGLGVPPPVASWGTLLAPLQRPAALAANPWIAAPAVALVLVVFAYQTLARSLHAEYVLPGSATPARRWTTWG